MNEKSILLTLLFTALPLAADFMLYPRGCFYCPEKFSSLEKVRNNRKLLIPLRCSEIISK